MTSGGPPTLLGALLAGGASRRYGTAKWRAQVGGVSMAQRAVQALAPSTDIVGVVGGDAAIGQSLGLEQRPDLWKGIGPLGGLATALDWAAEAELDGVVLLGCDLPLVGPEAVRALIAAWSGEEAMVPRGPDGPQPVCALYATRAAPKVRRALEAGGASLRSVVEALDAGAVDESVLEAAQGRRSLFLNVNTPTDRIRAEALIHDGPPLVCVVGKKNSGKTGLTVALAAELSRRGRRVMSVKHGHGFELDSEGTDSWRHRREGRAERVLLVGPDDVALLGRWGPEGEPPLRDLVDRYLAEAEIVIAEGWKVGPDPKIEVFRAAAHEEPVLGSEPDLAHTFLATVTDRDDYEASHPVYSLTDPGHVGLVADLVERVLLDGVRGGGS